MAEKTLNTRIVQKHDTAENWGSSNFIPYNGEFIIYEADSNYTIPRIKIGNKDKATPANLPFFYEGFTEEELLDVLTNRVNLSINPDDTIYNGGLGYKRGYRIRSGGVELEFETGMCSGYIEVKPGDVVAINQYKMGQLTVENAINAYSTSFENLGQLVGNYSAGGYGIFAPGAAYESYSWNSTTISGETLTWVVPPAESGVAYIRVTAWNKEGRKLKVVINGG